MSPSFLVLQLKNKKSLSYLLRCVLIFPGTLSFLPFPSLTHAGGGDARTTFSILPFSTSSFRLYVSPSSAFLKLSIIVFWGQVILCCRGLSCSLWALQPLSFTVGPGFYSLFTHNRLSDWKYQKCLQRLLNVLWLAKLPPISPPHEVVI